MPAALASLSPVTPSRERSPPLILWTGDEGSTWYNGCLILVDPTFPDVPATADEMGHALFTFDVPNDPSLLFGSLFHQVATDRALTPGVWVASNTLRVTFGGKILP